MKGLKSVRIRNLRSFGSDNDFIPLKKLNILVGNNSCGKSTFLRTFPLLRQSVQADTRNPILWYGSFVDFGDLKTAVNFNSSEVLFDFDLEIGIDDGFDFLDRLVSKFKNFDFSAKTTITHIPVMFTLGVSAGEGVEVVSRLKLEIDNVTIEILYKESKIIRLELSLDGDSLYKGFEGSEILEKGNLIPTDFSGRKGKKSSAGENWFIDRCRTTFRALFSDYVGDFHHTNKKRENIEAQLSAFEFCPKSKILDGLRKMFASDKAFISNINQNKEEVANISFALLIGSNLHKILTAIDRVVSDFYSGVRYLGPVRASAERFYRYQDLQVAEVDHTGSNLPMVLNSLDTQGRKLLNDWIKESFGFELRLTNTGSHYELSIKDADSEKYHNVSDMGFGYSQLLPIIVSIWLENNSKNNTPRHSRNKASNHLVLVIEQPELHLHPQLQHMFGRAIAKIAKLQSEASFCFILETHSKHIIDAIGECIEEGEIGSNDVSVTLFEKNKSGYTNTRLSSFDNSGYLTNWPAGFLSP